MRFTTSCSAAAAGLLALPFVSAFANTSPFFLFSTESLPSNLPISPYSSIATSQSFLDAANKVISQCTSDAYIIVSQPGIHASDLSHMDAAPRLRKWMTEAGERAISVEHGSGTLDIAEIEKVAMKECGAHVVSVDASTGTFQTLDENMKPKLIKVDFQPLSSDTTGRETQLGSHDAFLFSLIDMLPTSKYTVIYTTTPVSTASASVLHTHSHANDLRKRHVSEHIARGFNLKVRADNETTDYISPGNFEKYQYFTPGIYLSLMAVFVLLSILSVAVTAIASVKVSYLSFEKEMGPTEQKKQQ